MHYLEYVLAEGEGVDDAIHCALTALDEYEDRSFDYRADDAGGWDARVVSATLERSGFNALLNQARRSQAESMDTALRMIAMSIGLHELGIQPRASLPLTLDDLKRIGATLFERIHAQISGQPVPEYPDGLAFYSMEKAAHLLQGDFVCESHFLNATERFGRAAAIPADAEVDAALKDGARLWIVPIDVHN